MTEYTDSSFYKGTAADLRGPVGPQGPQGIRGADGPQGPTGPKGDSVTGPQGPVGPIGPGPTTAQLNAAAAAALIANPPPAGPQGPQGSVGDTGPQGLQGPKGDAGPQGIQGVQGVQGPKGDTGPAGAKGDTGAQGPQGNTGPAGPSDASTLQGHPASDFLSNANDVTIASREGYGRFRFNRIGSTDITAIGSVRILNTSGAATTTISENGGISTGGATVWNANNDGAGSGSDSDMVDGLHAVNFLRSFQNNWIADDQGLLRFFFGGDGRTYHRVKDSVRFQNSSGTDVSVVDESGNLTCNGNVTAFSDARLKTDVRTIEDPRSIVARLRGVRYTKDGLPSVGVIAQEVREVLPELVMEADDERKTLSVAYGNLTAVLIEAVKDLQAQVDQLKEQRSA